MSRLRQQRIPLRPPRLLFRPRRLWQVRLRLRQDRPIPRHLPHRVRRRPAAEPPGSRLRSGCARREARDRAGGAGEGRRGRRGVRAPGGFSRRGEDGGEGGGGDEGGERGGEILLGKHVVSCGGFAF